MDFLKRIERIEDLLKEAVIEIEKIKSDLTGGVSTENFESSMKIDTQLSDIAKTFK